MLYNAWICCFVEMSQSPSFLNTKSGHWSVQIPTCASTKVQNKNNLARIDKRGFLNPTMFFISERYKSQTYKKRIMDRHTFLDHSHQKQITKTETKTMLMSKKIHTKELGYSLKVKVSIKKVSQNDGKSNPSGRRDPVSSLPGRTRSDCGWSSCRNPLSLPDNDHFPALVLLLVFGLNSNTQFIGFALRERPTSRRGNALFLLWGETNWAVHFSVPSSFRPTCNNV